MVSLSRSPRWRPLDKIIHPEHDEPYRYFGLDVIHRMPHERGVILGQPRTGQWGRAARLSPRPPPAYLSMYSEQAGSVALALL